MKKIKEAQSNNFKDLVIDLIKNKNGLDKLVTIDYDKNVIIDHQGKEFLLETIYQDEKIYGKALKKLSITDKLLRDGFIDAKEYKTLLKYQKYSNYTFANHLKTKNPLARFQDNFGTKDPESLTQVENMVEILRKQRLYELMIIFLETKSLSMVIKDTLEEKYNFNELKKKYKKYGYTALVKKAVELIIEWENAKRRKH